MKQGVSLSTQLYNEFNPSPDSPEGEGTNTGGNGGGTTPGGGGNSGGDYNEGD